MAETQRLLGARIKRVEDPRFLTGRGRYVDDLPALPGTLHAAFVRSSYAHADLASVDMREAARLEGVHLAMTGAEMAQRARPITCDSAHPSWQGTEYHALAVERVRFVGEAVAAVVADDRYVAEDALELARVEYSPREVIASVEQAIADGAPRLHDGWEDNFFVKRQFAAGDVDAAFADADGVIEVELFNGRSTGVPLEPRGCVAHYDPAERTLTLWTSSQVPHLVRTAIADLLDFPEHRLRVVSPDVGGGFGTKCHLFPEEVAACVLSMQIGRPVKWIEDRREHMLAANHAREHHHTLKVAYQSDGTVTAVRALVYVDSGAYSLFPWTQAMEPGMALGIIPGPYRIRAYECEAYAVATNKSPNGALRGIARPAACFSIERAMDEVANELGMDVLDVRRRNLVRPEEFPYESITGLEYDSGSFIESLDKLRELADYDGLRREQEAARREGRYLGIGFGCYTEQSSYTTSEFLKRGAPIVHGFESSHVQMDPSGKVRVQVSTHSHGQGHETTFAQIAADRLGLPLDDVRVFYGDTSATPYGHGTWGSRSTVIAGGATHRAAEKVRDLLLRIGASELEAAVEDVDVGDGKVFVKGSPDSSIAIAELARYAYHRPERLPEGMEPALEAMCAYDAPPGRGTFANAAHLTVVEVDPETGGVKVLKYFVVEDCGRIVNSLVVDGQIHGGVAQGIGGALLEELVYDEDGQLKSTTFMDYLLPGATDIPHIETAHIETPSPLTIEGIKGMAEGPSIAPGPAIASAVADALRPIGRVFVNHIPLTPERVRGFVEQAAAGPALAEPAVPR
jgi:carbon-monoxide dehydrogenase large subunit